MDDLTPVLARLPEPTPPSTLTATVMARIEREAQEKVAALAVPARLPEVRAWLWTTVGVALVLGVLIYGSFEAKAMPDFISARIGIGRAPLMPIEGSAILLLGLGLLVYLAGLFAPMRSHKPQRAASARHESPR